MVSNIFRLIGDQEKGRAVAMKNYLPAEIEEELDEVVRSAMKSKKVI